MATVVATVAAAMTHVATAAADTAVTDLTVAAAAATAHPAQVHTTAAEELVARCRGHVQAEVGPSCTLCRDAVVAPALLLWESVCCCNRIVLTPTW